MVYCAKGSICSRRSKATVLSKKVNNGKQKRQRKGALLDKERSAIAKKDESTVGDNFINNAFYSDKPFTLGIKHKYFT